jgi:Glycosyltransferase sugar-binding region containing DXD motif
MTFVSVVDNNERLPTHRRSLQLPPVFRVLLCYFVAASLQFAYLCNNSLRDGLVAPSFRHDEEGIQMAIRRTRQINVSGTNVTRHDNHGARISLDELTQARFTTCPKGLVFIHNLVPKGRRRLASIASSPTAIPQIVHQTSKSRCVTQAVADAVSKWKFANWSYYFYDDESIERLFRSEFRSFPHLEMVASKCLLHGALRADLFRYLVLYRHGGIYADIDAVPRNFTPEAHLDVSTDGLFVIEQYHLLSQYFMAMSPRHPLMWYAIQHSLINLLQVPDTGRASASMVTGPHALHFAFQSFRMDVGAHVDPAMSGYKPVKAGTYVGTHNRSVTAIGRAEDQNQFVDRDVLRRRKKREYEKMDMTHFQDDKKHPTQRSCLNSLYDLYAGDAESA